MPQVRGLAFLEVFEAAAVHEIKIGAAVRVVVEHADAGGIRFDDVAFPAVAAGQMEAAQAGGVRRFDKARLRQEPVRQKKSAKEQKPDRERNTGPAAAGHGMSIIKGSCGCAVERLARPANRKRRIYTANGSSRGCSTQGPPEQGDEWIHMEVPRPPRPAGLCGRVRFAVRLADAARHAAVAGPG